MRNPVAREEQTYTIIIPSYNEGERLPATLDRLLSYIRFKGWDAEIIVVDDGSQDNTAQLARGYAEHHPEVRVLQNPGNRGRGYSVRNGVMHARGTVLLYTDADLSSPIEESAKLFAELSAGADVAIGSRWLDPNLQTQRQPLYRQMLGRVFNFLMRSILDLEIKDTECGFKAFTRSAAMSLIPVLHMDHWGMDSEMLFVAKKRGFVLKEIPVRWSNDPRTKVDPVLDSINQFFDLLRVRWYDMRGEYRDVPMKAPVTAIPALQDHSFAASEPAAK